MGLKKICFLLFLNVMAVHLFAQNFELSTKSKGVSIFYSKNEEEMDSLMAQILAKDIERVTGKKPVITTNSDQIVGNVIVLKLQSEKENSAFETIKADDFKNQKEVFSWKFVNHPHPKIKQAFIITGSDARGLAYGVFKLSEQIGVSPWYWWTDVTPQKKNNLSVPAQNYISISPSVKFRGIFINDEDWGLRPWAAHNQDIESKNIGPKTYEHVFELLLRLKANLIWPAMHPGTKAFFNEDKNLAMAKKYHIIIGTSHAEPMLRNNVDEWNENKMGPFNYLTNQKQVDKYWQERVAQSKNNEVIYTMGMRGIHDSGIEGVKSNKEAVPLLESIIKNQQEMLKAQLHTNNAPQAFVLYKEVLDIYDEGLKVPDDITLVWPDDNYGYIRRLNSKTETKRKGGAGVYYHASYWGRPHDYLWLSTTPPSLMQEEMVKAYNNEAKNIWVLNVGDIKPAEYQIQLFMDMAYRIQPFQKSEYGNQHITNWYQQIFGQAGLEAAKMISDYYLLALERKPEFMGWSQTEPTTQTKLTAYNHFYYGDEAQKRIDKYEALAQKANLLNNQIPSLLKDAFYELVKYPVLASANMNKKFLYRDKAVLYAQQGRLSAIAYKDSIHQAYQNMVKLTRFYNDSLAKGKWYGIMSMAPRQLPVYEEPIVNLTMAKTNFSWSINAEGDSLNRDTIPLPNLYNSAQRKYFIDIYLTQPVQLNWQISANDVVSCSQNEGVLQPKGKLQQRIWIGLKAHTLSQEKEVILKIATNLGNKYVKIKVMPKLQKPDVFTEENGVISIYAAHFSDKNTFSPNCWTVVNGLGYTQKAILSYHLKDSLEKDNSILTYQFELEKKCKPKVYVYTIPTLPLNKSYGTKYAIRIDDGLWKIQDFETKGRSETWKQNVLSNSAVQIVNFEELTAGTHQIQIKAIDPEVLLDRFVIDTGGLKPHYSLISETN